MASPLQRRLTNEPVQCLSPKIPSGEVFARLAGNNSNIPAGRFKIRSAVVYFRSFLDAAARKGIVHQPTRALRSFQVAAMFAAKAETNDNAAMSESEFDAAKAPLENPKVGVPLEASIAWGLLDPDGKGQVATVPGMDIARKLFADAGFTGAEDHADKVLEAANREDCGWLTQARHLEWFTKAANQPREILRLRPTPRQQLYNDEVTTGISPGVVQSFGRRGPTPEHVAKPMDAHLRNTECEGGFWKHGDATLGQARSLSPSWSRNRKLPGQEGRNALWNFQRPATTELALQNTAAKPKRLKPIPLDWQAMSESEARRQERLRPFMRVQADYVKHGGAKASAAGTLLSGWSMPSHDIEVPHAARPKGVRQAGAEFQPKMEDTPIGLKNVVKWRDTKNFVIVEIHGAERLLPRECIRPL